MNAIEQYFAFASNNICIWHTYQNILTSAIFFTKPEDKKDKVVTSFKTWYSGDVWEAGSQFCSVLLMNGLMMIQHSTSYFAIFKTVHTNVGQILTSQNESAT